jgi:hypothetical protein
MKSANCESVCVYSPRPDWQIDFRCTNAQVSWSVVSESGEHILEAFTNYVWPNFAHFDHLHGILYSLHLPTPGWQLWKNSFTIQMSHWRHTMVDGAKFWISCKRPAFLSSFSRLQLIQKSAHLPSCGVNVTSEYMSCNEMFLP